MTKEKKAALIALGCAKNLVDSEVMLGCLQESNFIITASEQDADVIIVNTCGFIRPAREEARREIERIIVLKNKFPEKKIIAAGCYVEHCKKQLKQKYPEVDEWLGVGDFDKVGSASKGEQWTSENKSFLYDHKSPRLISTSSVWSYVKISEGCSHRCSFCTIPLIKGKYQSRVKSSILTEAARMAEAGIREINLVSQDSTYYGRDFQERNGLANLLRSLVRIPHLQWIRFLYGYPEEITDELLDVMKDHENICPYLDIPFQHSSSRIIAGMRRGMTGDRAMSLLDRIRNKIPEISIRTSLITGFPGEKDKEFEELLHFIKRAEFDHLGVFTYSPEKGTDCYSLGDPIPHAVKEERRSRLMEEQARISYKKNERFLNRTLDVLFEGPVKDEPEIWAGRSRFQAPEVDGMVLIQTDNPKFVPENAVNKVEIIDREIYDLMGVLAK